MQTLHLFDELFQRACRWLQNGQERPAVALLHRLAAFPDLPDDLAEQLHARLAEYYLRRRHYRRARRHLTIALGYRPTAARYHFLLGLALHHDPAGDLERAAHHYAQALARCPRQVRLLLEAGQLALMRGLEDEGLHLLQRAAELAPDEASVLRRVVQGLCQCGKPDEALRVIRLARFRNPDCPRLQQLASDLQLQLLRRDQQYARLNEEEAGPVLLPFLRPVSGQADELPSQPRLDSAESLPGPHLVRLPRPMSYRRAP